MEKIKGIHSYKDSPLKLSLENPCDKNETKGRREGIRKEGRGENGEEGKGARGK